MPIMFCFAELLNPYVHVYTLQSSCFAYCIFYTLVCLLLLTILQHKMFWNSPSPFIRPKPQINSESMLETYLLQSAFNNL